VRASHPTSFLKKPGHCKPRRAGHGKVSVSRTLGIEPRWRVSSGQIWGVYFCLARFGFSPMTARVGRGGWFRGDWSRVDVEQKPIGIGTGHSSRPSSCAPWRLRVGWGWENAGWGTQNHGGLRGSILRCVVGWAALTRCGKSRGNARVESWQGVCPKGGPSFAVETAAPTEKKAGSSISDYNFHWGPVWAISPRLGFLFSWMAQLQWVYPWWEPGITVRSQ
jgi:hypothetical protein